jgi:hypothetical protein
MEIAKDRLTAIKQSLHNLVDERTSAPWASYSEDELARDEQDREDIERIKTVGDVYQWLRDQGGRTTFIEWLHCLDPLNGFKVDAEGPPDERDENAFRRYLRATYGVAAD